MNKGKQPLQLIPKILWSLIGFRFKVKCFATELVMTIVRIHFNMSWGYCFAGN